MMQHPAAAGRELREPPQLSPFAFSGGNLQAAQQIRPSRRSPLPVFSTGRPPPPHRCSFSSLTRSYPAYSRKKPCAGRRRHFAAVRPLDLDVGRTFSVRSNNIPPIFRRVGRRNVNPSAVTTTSAADRRDVFLYAKRLETFWRSASEIYGSSSAAEQNILSPPYGTPHHHWEHDTPCVNGRFRDLSARILSVPAVCWLQFVYAAACLAGLCGLRPRGATHALTVDFGLVAIQPDGGLDSARLGSMGSSPGPPASQSGEHEYGAFRAAVTRRGRLPCPAPHLNTHSARPALLCRSRARALRTGTAFFGLEAAATRTRTRGCYGRMLYRYVTPSGAPILRLHHGVLVDR
ncbi:hypothetical protein AcW2_005337 [Taiwanofungus camphoratus]|nr:hypothetical protein AcW2_005337 [Antrodia cinnamomea]